jgi:hypothetical protein
MRAVCVCVWFIRTVIAGYGGDPLSSQQIRYPIRNPVQRHSNTWQYLKHLYVWETFKEIFLIH